MASTVRFIAGTATGACALLLVLLYVVARDEKPALFLVLALSVWAAVRYGSGFGLAAIAGLLFLRQQARGDSVEAWLAGTVSLVWLVIGIRERNRIVVVMTAIPLLCFLVLLAADASIVPVTALFLANAMTMAGLAYRGWAHKRLVD